MSSTAGANAALYYHNETDGLYYACETSVDYAQRMEDVLTGYGGNSATFAFEFSADAGLWGAGPICADFLFRAQSTQLPQRFSAVGRR